METTSHGQVPSPPSGFLGARHGSAVPTHRWHLDIARRYGDVVRIRRFGPISYYFISNPRDIEHVLRVNHRNYCKPRVLRKRLGLLLGEGLFTAEGDHWLRQRRLVQPAFHRERLATFATHMTEAALDVADRWHGHAASGEPVDVVAEMMPLALRVVSKSLFGTDTGRQTEDIRREFEVAFTFVDHHLRARIGLPLLLPTPRNRRFRAARAALDHAVFAIIDQRRRSGEHKDDLLSMLLEARDADTGEMMTVRQVRDEVITLMLAGHETSAVALSWIWYLLSQHPEAEHRLHAELGDVLGGRVPTIEDLPHLRYTRMVIDEALRLYPPALAVARQSKEMDILGGYNVPARAYIVMYPYVTHHSPDYWEDPGRFEPQRFNPDLPCDRPAFAYFPFGGGPRQCIGNGFALIEVQLVLATLAQLFSLSVASDWQVVEQASIVLRPSGGLQMTVADNPAAR